MYVVGVSVDFQLILRCTIQKIYSVSWLEMNIVCSDVCDGFDWLLTCREKA